MMNEMVEAEEKLRQDNEAFYDADVAPVLADLAKKCQSRGMPLIAMVGNQGDTYCTRYMTDFKNCAMRIAYYVSKTRDNVDALFMAIEKDAEKYGGDNSIYLWKLRHYRKLIDEGLNGK